MATPTINASRGSTWHRWDPHTHAPGTVLNDQFTGADPWKTFQSRIEVQDPPVRALGITDYFLVDTYEEARKRRAAGEFKGIGLLFPNVEIRLSIETASSSPINAHLLFSPEDDDHIERIRRLLSSFSFRYLKDDFRCERSELIRLGKKHDATVVDDVAALAVGANQFKISFEALQQSWETNDWFRNNCLVAVAGGEKDGTSGLRDEAGSFAAFRKSIEGFAHIIFSANPKQIAFYLGQGKATPDDLNAKWGGQKPCLHGSDAHSHGAVGKPALDRYCWIKGEFTFDTLRQVCMEPEGRVFIGKEPPRGALPGNTIRSITMTNAPWMSPSAVELNSGLVAIIGSRGSGKTALADLIAMGGCAVSRHVNEKSFLRRAKAHLAHSKAELSWESGDCTSNTFASLDAEDLVDVPHVQYLSQQFVDQLCSAEGIEDPLVREIQRVVFDAHPEDNRMGATTFEELLDIRLDGARTSRQRHVDALLRASNLMTEQQLRQASLPALVKDRDAKQLALANDEKDRKALLPKGDAALAKRHDELSNAVDSKRTQVAEEKLKLQALRHLVGDVRDHRERVFPQILEDLQDGREDANLSEDDWRPFGVQFAGDVDGLLNRRIQEATKRLNQLEGAAPPSATATAPPDPSVPLIFASSDLASHSLHLLERELARLQGLVGIETLNSRRLAQLSEKMAKARTALAKVVADIAKAEGAAERIDVLRLQRRAAYAGVFQAVVDEESALEALYQPLKERIAEATGSLSKLSFSVRRAVDVDQWAKAGEALLDLRTGAAFKGKGSISTVASLALEDAWKSGSAEQAGEALLEFVKAHSHDLRAQRPGDMAPKEWARDISVWLFSTDHISVGYGLKYDGLDIEQLSPGTRGIVLLLLYLAVDAQDDRPLVIDQPEENLDPQSIYDELVAEFQRAKKRRQVIIVTHNANLVVNTDADQVIVARSGSHRPGQLPVITYESGGLENSVIRKAVCSILEGGERAFRERAKRLRVFV
ncbi:MAG: TrlF family AAA-like ATPase [Burkholderiales bacterium]